MTKININTLYITLGQFLKLVNVIGSGGEAKMFLSMNSIYVNEELETRRGRKLYSGYKVKIMSEDYEITRNEN